VKLISESLNEIKNKLEDVCCQVFILALLFESCGIWNGKAFFNIWKQPANSTESDGIALG